MFLFCFVVRLRGGGVESSELTTWRQTRIDSAHPRPESDHRTHYETDYDRILYSSSYRRLASVSQVTLASEGQLIHNRQLHSHKVSRLAGQLARLVQDLSDGAGLQELIDQFGGLDESSTAAGALAHDIGHPPFGHIGERTLSRLVTGTSATFPCSDGYEGNAQAFRIAVRLACLRQHADSGLNLTFATLNAMQKYPWTRSAQVLATQDDGTGHEKYGTYDEDAGFLETARGYLDIGRRRALEAQIVDIADDITYAVHDLEDFFRAGRIPLTALRHAGAAHSLHQTIVARCEDEWRNLSAVDAWVLGSPTVDVAGSPAVPTGTFDDTWQRTISSFRDMGGDYIGLASQRGALRDYTGELILRLMREVQLSEEFGVALASPARADVVLLNN